MAIYRRNPDGSITNVLKEKPKTEIIEEKKQKLEEKGIFSTCEKDILQTNLETVDDS